MTTSIKFIVSILISAVFLFLAFKDIHFSTFYGALQETEWSVVIALSLLVVLSMVIRAWRWKMLLKPLKNIPYHSVFSFTMIGFMSNNVLPAHAGEIVRAYLIGRKEGISRFGAFTTIIIERLFDVLALVLLFLYVLIVSPMPRWFRNGGLFFGTAGIVLLTALMILSLNKRWGRNLLFKLAEKVPPRFRSFLQNNLKSFLSGLDVLKEWKSMAGIFLVSILLWLVLILTVGVMLWRYPLEVELSPAPLFLLSTTVIVLLSFAIIIPSSPGYFGVTQLVFVIAFELVNLSKVDALACSVILNLTQYIPITLIGVFYLFKEGYSFREIRVAEETPAE